MSDERLVITGLSLMKEDYLARGCYVNPHIIDRAIELLNEKGELAIELQKQVDLAFDANKKATARIKKLENDIDTLQTLLYGYETGALKKGVSENEQGR